MSVPEPLADLDRSGEHHWTPCGDGEMKWRVWGTGAPLVLLHGSHGSWAHWVRNIATLQRHHRVIVPDMPGYGESAPPADLDNAATHARAIAAGLQRLSLPSSGLDVVGFSLGATIGTHLAIAAPQLVRRLVIVDAGGLDTPMPMVHLGLRALRGLKGTQLLAARRNNLHTMMIHDLAKIDDLALWIDANTPRPRTRVHHQVIPDKLLRALRRVPSVQLDVIWGENDRPHPDPQINAAAVRTVQPDAELRVIPGAGHWSMFEGAEAFNKHLLALLRTPLRKRDAADN